MLRPESLRRSGWWPSLGSAIPGESAPALTACTRHFCAT